MQYQYHSLWRSQRATPVFNSQGRLNYEPLHASMFDKTRSAYEQHWNISRVAAVETRAMMLVSRVVGNLKRAEMSLISRIISYY